MKSMYAILIVLLIFPVTAVSENQSFSELTNIPDDIFNAQNAQIPDAQKNSDGFKLLLLQQDLAKKEIISLRENNRIWAIVSVCFISIIGLVIVIVALKTMGGKASDIVNASGLNFIVFGTIILVTVSDTEQQLTAAMGVLGAIAGYLFGTMKEKVNKEAGAGDH